MPSWIPGSYLLREFARHVVCIEATSGGRAVAIQKVASSRWRCSEPAAELTVTATIYGLEQSVRDNYIDRPAAPSSTGLPHFCSRKVGTTNRSNSCSNRPTIRAARTGGVATAMTPVDVDERGFGVYRAANYDELVDHPVEISDFASVSFKACGVPHRLVVAGRFHSDLDRVAADLARICEAHIEFFGQPAPFDEYLFLGLAVGDGYGGLEHRASSSLIHRRDDLPKPGETGVSKNYGRFLGLASHEYFHSWHVKRTKPAAFTPYRLDRRNHNAPVVGLRRHHELLPGIAGAAQRTDRCEVLDATRRRTALARLPGARPLPTEHFRFEFRRLGRTLQARSEHAEHQYQLLQQGCADGARARSHAASLDGWHRFA